MKARGEARLGPWVARAVLAILGVASCLCSGSPTPPAQPAASAPAPPPPPVTPDAIAGNWLFEMKAGGRSIEGSLHFTATNGILAGSLTRSDGNEQELSNIKIDGDKISFDLAGQRATQHADGTVGGSSMKGTIKIKASGGRRSGRGGDSADGSDEAAPPPSGGGGYRGGGRGRGRGGSGRAPEITWSAYKSVAPPSGERSQPTPPPTPERSATPAASMP